MKQLFQKKLSEKFPSLSSNSNDLVKKIVDCAIHKSFTAGIPLKVEGEYCSEFVFLLDGEKRVYKRSDSGREITLYEMGPGDVCVLNATSILSNSKLPANADALTDASALMLPADEFRRLIQEYETMRLFVYRRINDAFVAITSLISEIVFRKMDQRLVQYLIEKSDDGIVNCTHQRIADSMGTSREVISRLLKDFERQRLLSMSRGKIRLFNRLYEQKG